MCPSVYQFECCCTYLYLWCSHQPTLYMYADLDHYECLIYVQTSNHRHSLVDLSMITNLPTSRQTVKEIFYVVNTFTFDSRYHIYIDIYIYTHLIHTGSEPICLHSCPRETRPLMGHSNLYKKRVRVRVG
jgi:hypothetical protein